MTTAVRLLMAPSMTTSRPVMIVVRVVVFAVGAAAVNGTVFSAVRTFVVPRAIPVVLSRVVFQSIRRVLMLFALRAKRYEDADRLLAFYAPVSLLVLPAVWLTIVWGAFSAMDWAVDGGAWRSMAVSGSSLVTLGLAQPASRPAFVMAVVEAALGIALLALLITYLPTIYGAFQRREALVALLDVRAGNPPWGVEMLLRFQRIGLRDTEEFWARAEAWFADVEESHTSLASVVFFRSPDPFRSWITAAGAVLDGAALSVAVLEPPAPAAQLCIRSGYICLRRIADFFSLPYDPSPRPTDPISISREEFDEAYDLLAGAGAPVRPDRDMAWADFAGWRVNYDAVLLRLAGLVRAPLAPWSSDRSLRYMRPPLTKRGRQARMGQNETP